MPDDETYSVPTLDDFAAWYSLQLVTPAGEQFGILSDAVNDAFGFAKGTFVDPAVGAITGWVADIGKTVWHTLLAGLGFVLKWAYSILRGWLLGAIPSHEWPLFPDPKTLFGADPLFLLSLILNLLWNAIKWTVSNVGDWVWNRVRAGLGYADWGWTSLGHQVQHLISAVAPWIVDRLTDIMGFKAFGWISPGQQVQHIISAVSPWIVERVRDALGYAGWGWTSLAHQVQHLISAVAPWIVDRVQDIVNALWAQVQAALSALPGIPGTLLDSVQALVNAAVGWLWEQIKGAIFGVSGAVTSLAEAVYGYVTDAASWLWGQIEPRLTAIAGAVVAGAQEVLSGLGEILKDAFSWIFQNMLSPFVDVFQHKASIPGRVLAGEYESFGDFLEDLMDPPMNMFTGIQFFFWAIFAGVLSIFVAFMPALAPLNQKWAMETARFVAPSQPAESSLLQMLRRGLVSEPEARLSLERRGYNAAWINALIALEEVIPGVSDMIRMGVREAFTPEIAGRFGQYEDLPPALVEWGDKIGLSQEWVARFWAAHWDLPSADQGFEMFHRGVISRDELLLLLRALDIMPFWRENLEKIAYRIPTRVDVRRMYQAGAVDLAYVKQRMLDSGYRPADADAITEWVRVQYAPGGEGALGRRKDLTEAAIKQAYARRLITRDEAQERLLDLYDTVDEAEFILSLWDFDFFTNPDWRSDIQPKELTRSVIEQAYARGLVDANAASAQLEELGFTPEDAALLLQLVDFKTNGELADLEADVAVQEYRGGIIDEAALAARLRDLNFPEARIELVVLQETLRRQAKPARLTLAQLQRALRGGVIDAGEFVVRLDAMGYNQRDVQILVAIT